MKDDGSKEDYKHGGNMEGDKSRKKEVAARKVIEVSKRA